jgi:hypothetical protein
MLTGGGSPSSSSIRSPSTAIRNYANSVFTVFSVNDGICTILANTDLPMRMRPIGSLHSDFLDRGTYYQEKSVSAEK